MSRDIEINKRLLKAFSVDGLKTVFNLTDSKERHDGLLNIAVRTNSDNVIEKTIFDNFSLLKQYIYFYEFNGILNDYWLDKHPAFINMQKMTKSHIIYNLLVPIKYEGYNKTQGKAEIFEFLVPVQIHKKKTVLRIHINILERDIPSLTTDKIISPSRDLNDEGIIKKIIPYANPTTLYRYDLNKGIKHLWHIDEIDALKVKFKKSKSMSHEIMDGDNLIKKELPSLYAELIESPVRQTTFRVLKQNNLVNFIAIDPTAGICNFSVFPQHLNGINNLIDLIIINN